MTDDFGIWEVDEAGKTAHLLETAGSAGTEAWLEDVLVQNPAMLMPGLQLVGRQLPAANGALDLLGVDSEGRLVVFELKREKLRREAVAQAVDYASWLEALDDAKLGKLVAENSGQREIDKIEDFESWYGQRWESMDSLKPVRIVLVGLGADEPARRMADWLARKGVEIDLLTFLGYRHGDRMLLARRLEGSDEAPEQGRVKVSRATKEANWREAMEGRIDEYRMRGWWPEVFAMLERNSRPSYLANSGITFYPNKRRTLSGRVRAHGSYKIEIVPPGVARIVFFPAAVDLCLQEFEELKDTIPFDCERPSNAPVTEKVAEQWFCRLDETRWKEHQDSIAGLVRMVDERWRDAAE